MDWGKGRNLNHCVWGKNVVLCYYRQETLGNRETDRQEERGGVNTYKNRAHLISIPSQKVLFFAIFAIYDIIFHLDQKWCRPRHLSV